MASGQEVLPARQRLVVQGTRIAAHCVRDAGGFHQVAFIAAVDEYRRFENVTRGGPQADDAAGPLLDCGKPAIEQHENAGFFQPIVESALGDAGLEPPRDRFSIMLAGAFEELARITADHALLAVHVGASQAAGEHSAGVAPRLEKRDTRALLCGRDGRDRTARGSAINHHVESLRRHRAKRCP